LRLGVSFAGVAGETRVEGVLLSTGEVIDCSHVLIGVGANPEIGLAIDAGLSVENGIVVDDHARTSDANIWAAGDCANFPSRRYGKRIRFESVPNAIEQAKAAAANMAGGDVVYDPLPWFWSDQYDVKLQTVGLFDGHDETIVRGDPNARRFSVWYLKAGELLAVDAINDPAAFAMGKIALAKSMSVDRRRLAAESIDLRDIIK
jgi:3-phenylpropionate/trans-cinnamate dioxygenase ferredoxin reductase subunit